MAATSSRELLSTRRGLAGSLALLALLAAALSYGWLHAPFVLDDIPKIVENPDLRSLPRLAERLVYPYTDNHVAQRNDPSRPLVFLTLAVNFAAGGVDPFGYHLVNALLHLLNAALVLFVCRRLLGVESRGALASVVPLATALLFLCSPVNQGTAAYVYARSDLLNATFSLTALLLLWPRACAGGPRGDAGRVDARAIVRHGLGLIAVAAALGSKQSAAVLPLLLFALAALLAGGDATRARVPCFVSVWLVTLAFVALRWVYLGGVGDLEAEQVWPTSAYVALQPIVAWRYIALLLIPSGLAIDHQLEPLTSAWPALVALLPLGASAAAAAWAHRRGHLWGRDLLIAATFFALCLAPTSSFLPTADAMVERRVYLASAGFYFGLSASLAQLGAVVAGHLRPRAAAAARVCLPAAAALALLVLFATVSLQRNHVLADPERLWLEVIASYPKSHRAHHNLAALYASQGRLGEAVALYEKVIAWYPDAVPALANLGELLLEPGTAYANPERGVALIERALALSPRCAPAHHKLGWNAQARGDFDAAARHYLAAIASAPRYLAPRLNLAVIYAQRGDIERARREYEAILEIDPGFLPARVNLRSLGARRRPLGP